MPKICPLMSKAAEGCKKDVPLIAYCQESQCALWVTVYTTEKIAISCCSFEFSAMKVNQDGKNYYQV